MEEDYASKSRVFNGVRWEDVDSILNEGSGALAQGQQQQQQQQGQRPLPPMLDRENGNIFVSIVSYRDGKRCGETLKSLYGNASDPNKVFVGLVEQNKPEDTVCMVQFCHLDRELCDARSNQIRYLASFDLASQGPIPARALQRKNLADEEFCLQIDSHMSFLTGWDSALREEWLAAQNEYAVISTMPPNTSDQALYEQGGDRAHQVPRVCHLERSNTNFPMFTKPPNSFAVNLKTPLLAHSWNAGFSFHKCHMEEVVPYDFFMPQIFDGEEFTRFARLWTRGYDVYTPTKNVVFHDSGPEPEGHNMKGWPKLEIVRELSLHRLKTLLQMPAGDHSEVVQANFGLYGLGKRRSMDQLMKFIGVDFTATVFSKSIPCGSKEWVPYDYRSVTAAENLYDHPNDLDPQPEFPLRTASQLPNIAPDALSTSFLLQDVPGGKNANISTDQSNIGTNTGGLSPSVTFALWILGLILWYKIFVSPLKKRQVISGLHSKAKKAGRKAQNQIGISSILNPSFSTGEKDA